MCVCVCVSECVCVCVCVYNDNVRIVDKTSAFGFYLFILF